MENQAQNGASIILYIVCFLITTALAGLAQIFSQKSRTVSLAPSVTQSTRPSRLFWLFSCLVPILLSAFRWKVGTDYNTYVYLYNSFTHIDTLDRFIAQLPVTEPAYILLNFFVKAVFNHYLWVFALAAVITVAFFYRAMEDYHEKTSIMLAVFVFVTLIFSNTLNIVRQMIAVAIVFYATRYVFQKKYGKATLWLIVALTFHYSALVVVPFWILRGAKRWQKNARIILFGALAAFVVGMVMFRSVFSNVPMLGELAGMGQQKSTLGFGLLFMRAPILIPVILYRKRLVAHDERNYLWIIFAIFELVFSAFGYIVDFFSRFSLYFSLSWIVLLPSLVRCMPTRAAQYRMGAYVVLIAAGMWVYNYAICNFATVLPYKSIFDAYFAGML